MKTSNEYQKDFRRRMAENHEHFSLYIPKKDYARVQELALREGWINRTGRNSGQPHIQQALTAVISEGLSVLENGQIDAGQVRQIVETWQKECAGRESSPRFEKVAKLLAEISALLPPMPVNKPHK
jgi:hypothetical protein